MSGRALPVDFIPAHCAVIASDRRRGLVEQ